MRKTNRVSPSVVAAILVLGGAVGAWALVAERVATEDRILLAAGPRSAWTEMQWPFPVDPWGKGKAFQCKSGKCGAEVNVYLRAKLGYCNCVTGIADDADLDRMGDLDLIARQVLPLGAGRPISVGSMRGRSRAYRLTARPNVTVLSIAFNERCDMIVATAVVQHDRPAAIEPAVMEFLNSRTMLHWAEVTLGL